MTAAVQHPRISEKKIAWPKFPASLSHLYRKVSALNSIDGIVGCNLLDRVGVNMIPRMVVTTNAELRNIKQRVIANHNQVRYHTPATLSFSLQIALRAGLWQPISPSPYLGARLHRGSLTIDSPWSKVSDFICLG